MATNSLPFLSRALDDFSSWLPEIDSTTLTVFVAGAVVAVVSLYGFNIAMRMRDTIAFKLRRVVVGMSLYILGLIVGENLGWTHLETAGGAFLLSVFALRVVPSPRRSRYIDSQTRRGILSRDLKGEPFDGRNHHIDHIVPYSKGGDNSPKNLRVIPRTKNLKKGAKMPGIRDVL